MELEITVRAMGEFWHGGATIIVPEPMVETFEPLKTCDSPTISYVTGDVLCESMAAKRVLMIRDDASTFLSKAIADHLLSEMKKLDTHNGYENKQ